MFVIEAIPLTRSPQLDTLSYFSAESYPVGSRIEIPVRGRTTFGIVVDVKPVSSTKTALRAATFSLRKLPPQTKVTTLSPHLLDTVRTLHERLPAQFGQLLFSLLPPEIRTGEVEYPHVTPSSSHEDATPQVFTAATKERFIAYLTLVRGAFAHRGSIVLVVPTSPTVLEAYERLKKGIEDRIVCFAGYQTKKERQKAYEAFNDLSHTKLIITTPNYAYLDRTDITHIIIESAGSSHYLTHTRPLLDHREALKIYARHTKRALILGDSVPRTEDEHKRREEIYLTYGEHSSRLAFPLQTTVVTQTDKPTKESPFELFSPHLAQKITTALEGRYNVLLLSSRRGLAPVVACYDCGYIFRCPDSGTPYSLLRTTKNGVEERWFYSSTSGSRVRAADVCANCGSWRLRERGIGIQFVEDECRKKFPGTDLVVFDHTTATTHKKALALITAHAGKKGAILLATPMVFPYLFKTHIYLSAIVSLDAARAIPSWRADETFFRTLLTLQEHTEHECIIQSRQPADDVLLYASRGALDRFYEDEIRLRATLAYPPFSTFILITWQGTEAHVKEIEAQLKTHFAALNLEPQFYTNPLAKPAKPIRHCLIRLIDQAKQIPLANYLRALPPHIIVTVNPERIV